jgi:hypothetical protein
LITKRTVFVLGAGSMVDYQFPTGWELVQKVIEACTGNPMARLLMDHGGFTDRQLEHFVKALDGSAQNSIDAFLEARGDEFLAIGVAAMSMVLIRCEISANLYRERNPYASWLRNLWMHMGAPFLAEAASGNAVSFVTFNYDRSLEFFLCRALAETYAKTEEEAGAILNDIPIVHLHGRLGYLPWQREGETRPYDTTVDRNALRACANNVKVVNRNTLVNAEEFARARKLLSEAERIHFLGVGFNNQNLSRLGVMDLPDDRANATGIGLVQKEFEDLMKGFARKLTIVLSSNCIDLFRSHISWA